MISTIISESTIILVIDGRTEAIPRDAANAGAILEELSKPVPDKAQLLKLVCLKSALKEYSDGELEIFKDETVTYRGKKLPEILARRVFNCYRDGVPFTHLLKFFSRLDANTSQRAVKELYPFLEHLGMPITPKGTFLGYKGIRNDWLDRYTGTVLNKPGCTPTMKRQEVNDDCTEGCSVGFHVGSLEYATMWAGDDGRVVIVEVDPADVVSIPKDCEYQKLRTCSYKVRCESKGAMTDSAVEDADKPYETAYKSKAEHKDEDDLQAIFISISELF